MKVIFNKPAFYMALCNSGLSMADLIKRANVNNKTVYNLIDGTHAPRPKTLGKIAKALDIDICYLATWVEV